jgi:hypothetical protein
LPSVREGSGEHLASKDGHTCATHPLHCDEHLSLLFDHRGLCIGRVAFLLDLTKLGLDQGDASVFAFEFATQPIRQRMTFCGLEGGKVDPGPAQLRLDVTDTLCEQQSLDPIDMARAFSDKTLPFPMRASSIFFLDRGHAHDGTDVAFSPIGRDQGAQERQNVDAVSLDAASAAIDLDASRIQDTALDADLGQCPGQPEAVISGFVTDQNPTVISANNTQPANQFRDVAAGDAMNARPITVGMCDTQYPCFLAQFDCRIHRSPGFGCRLAARHDCRSSNPDENGDRRRLDQPAS